MKNLTLLLFTLTFLSCHTKMAVIKKGNKCGLINSKGKIIVEPKWDNIEEEYSGLWPVEKDSLWGYIDWKGKVIIEPQYSDADNFYHGLAFVANEQNKFGVINIQGDTVIGFKYDWSTGGFEENGLADVRINDSCGYINRKGDIVIPLNYSSCYPFVANRAIIKKCYRCDKEMINQEGQIFEYTKKKSYQWFKINKLYGLINDKGDTIIPPNFVNIQDIYEGMYKVKTKDKKWGAYSKKGKLIIQPQFDELSSFQKGIAKFQINKKCGFISNKGEIVIEPTFDYAEMFSNGFAYVEKNGKAGFINKKGKIVIPILYEPYRYSRFNRKGKSR